MPLLPTKPSTLFNSPLEENIYDDQCEKKKQKFFAAEKAPIIPPSTISSISSNHILNEYYHQYALKNYLSTQFQIPLSFQPVRKFIIYLEPRKSSCLFKSLTQFFKQSEMLYGFNEAHLYHPHTSMTGFFQLISSDHLIEMTLLEILNFLDHFLFRTNSLKGNKLVRLDKIFQPKASKLNLEIQADSCFHSLIEKLAAQFSNLSLIRPKKIDHISLVYFNKSMPTLRSHTSTEMDELEYLAKELVSLEEMADTEWDIVFYELLHPSAALGVPHEFFEIARWHI